MYLNDLTTAGLLIRYAHMKNQFASKQKGYDNSETTVGKLSTGQIRFCHVYFCLGIILKVILNNFQNNALRKMYRTESDSPRRIP